MKRPFSPLRARSDGPRPWHSPVVVIVLVLPALIVALAIALGVFGLLVRLIVCDIASAAASFVF
jgi:hypothetical protein